MRKAVLYNLDEQLLESLKKRLEQKGFAEILASGTAQELYAQAVKNRAEVAVLEVTSSDREVESTVRKLWEKLEIPIIAIAERSAVESVQKWGESMLWSVLARPVREEELVAAVVLSVSAARRIQKLKEEVASLKDTIESRKLVEKAKGRLMERDRLSEAEAFRRMQRLAMDRRISMRQLAEAILLAERLGA